MLTHINETREENLRKYYSADIAVVGAGHAGIEAALAAARLGLSTVLFTLNLDAVGNMPCNPSIGGTGKGQLVFELDALGGEMARVADIVTIQSRTLNESKGPAVQSKRVQADRFLYRQIMKSVLESQPNLILVQAEITELVTEPAPGGKRRVVGLRTRLGAEWSARAVILCTGTFLDSRVVVGEAVYPSGPDGMLPSERLSKSLREAGISLMRFKTGTPPRVHADTVDLERLEIQYGEKHITPFSTLTDEEELNSREQIPCRIVYTNAKTHAIIRENLHRSPLYSGVIEGVGPRYCPSIEDKVVRFADKERHQLFVEPLGRDTKELYLQGFSSSLPEDVQIEMLHSLEGFENARMTRTAYAIEYDCADPTQLYPTLEFKEIENLYGAGQFNGTSGYEEAAVQGLVAGINAARKLLGQKQIVLTRESSYIGMLIDDLVTKGTNEPYRVMTSRSEFRLLLRQDNAYDRLAPIGREVGLLSEERYKDYIERAEMVKKERERFERTTIRPSPELNRLLEEKGGGPITVPVKLADLLRRPGVDCELLAAFDPTRTDIPESLRRKAEIELKYEGYIKRQLAEAERMKKLAEKKLPPDFDYSAIKGLSNEAVQKLNKIKPADIGQASRISGVSPADIGVLLIFFGIK